MSTIEARTPRRGVLGGSVFGTGPVADPFLGYSLRAIKTASIAALTILTLITVYVALPSNHVHDKVACFVILAIALSVSIVIALVPWATVLTRPNGRVGIWMWTVMMLILIELGIGFTGSGQSQFFVLLVVAITFLAGPLFPIGLEVILDAAAIAGYAVVVNVAGLPISAATLVVRMFIMAAAALGVGLLAYEVTNGLTKQVEARVASERRVELWRTVAALMQRIDAPAVDEVLSAVVQALGALGFESAGICAVDVDNGTYAVLQSTGMPASYTSAEHRASTGVVGTVLADHRTVVSEDYQTSTDADPELRAAGFRTVIAGPVWSDGELAGVLEAGTRIQRSLEPEEVAAFDTLAAQAGRALGHANLFEHHRAAADQYRRLIESSPDATLVSDVHGTVLQASKQAAVLFGMPEEELVGIVITELMPERVRDRQMALVQEWAEGIGPNVIGVDHSVLALRKDGREVPVEATFSTVDGPDGRVFVVAIRDVTERRDFEMKLAHQATHDRLTGLPNRDLFLQRLEHALDGRDPDGPPVTIFFLDLDHFKYMNDSRGHRVGDVLVKSVAERLSVMADGNLVARIGGDEFGLLAEDLAGQGDAVSFAEHFLSAFDLAFRVDDIDCHIAASVGIAFGEAGDAADLVVRNADAAMFRAKRNGRGRVEFFDQRLTAEANERVATQSALHLALDREEFKLVYQPVVALTDERMVGMEALIRWHRPDIGMVPPDRFITLAEETGLIVPIGRWVLNEACRQLSDWRTRFDGLPDVSVSVNVSGRQLENDRFIDDVDEALRRTGLPPSLLVLEITESIFIHNVAGAVRRLNSLKELGVRLAIDDFGTGFSSLFSLSRLPVDMVKIDKAFIDGLGTRYDAVVSAVVTLGNAFDLDVVAEGIEEQAQRDRLIALGCRYAQGYFFARPLDVADAESKMETLTAGRSPIRPSNGRLGAV